MIVSVASMHRKCSMNGRKCSIDDRKCSMNGRKCGIGDRKCSIGDRKCSIDGPKCSINVLEALSVIELLPDDVANDTRSHELTSRARDLRQTQHRQQLVIQRPAQRGRRISKPRFHPEPRAPGRDATQITQLEILRPRYASLWMTV